MDINRFELLNKPIVPNDSPSLAQQTTLASNIPLGNFFFLSVVTSGIWLFIALSEYSWIATVYFSLLALYSLILLHQRQVVKGFAILTYLAVLQPAIRRYAIFLPYHALDYFLVIWAGYAFISLPKKQNLSLPAIFYLFYVLLEATDLFRTNNFTTSRGIFLPSLSLGIMLALATRFRINKRDLVQIFMACLLGVINLIVIIRYILETVQSMIWTGESSFASSGMMGPVQISMLLSIGVIICLILTGQSQRINLFIYVFLAGIIGYFMVLTFSRNGLYLTILALFFYYILFQKPTFRTIFLVLVVLPIVGFIAFSQANSLTEDALIKRFSDTDPTNRTSLVMYGWQIFLDYPVWGIGTGNYSRVVSREEYFGNVSGAHNELIRAAAEHGVGGLLIWSLFALSASWSAFRYAKGKIRALRMAFLVVFFAYTAVNGLKLTIQPALLILALNTFDSDYSGIDASLSPKE